MNDNAAEVTARSRLVRESSRATKGVQKISATAPATPSRTYRRASAAAATAQSPPRDRRAAGPARATTGRTVITRKAGLAAGDLPGTCNATTVAARDPRTAYRVTALPAGAPRYAAALASATAKPDAQPPQASPAVARLRQRVGGHREKNAARKHKADHQRPQRAYAGQEAALPTRQLATTCGVA